MTEEPRQRIRVLPYSKVIGNDDLKAALEISYVAELGVLATGQRGTAKSTTVRAFCQMMYDDLPVTLPIGVTDDRVLGGWRIEDLLADKPSAEWDDGLLVKASRNRLLYVDEVNLLDDHTVNVVLDAAGTGILTVHRDNADRPPARVDFAIIGSMNPSEGPLRPQLLDRFGLVVTLDGETTEQERIDILRSVLEYDRVRADADAPFMKEAARDDAATRQRLVTAKDLYRTIPYPEDVIAACARISESFGGIGRRGEIAMARAAKAQAALERADAVRVTHLAQVARFALIHRRPGPDTGVLRPWGTDDEARLADLLGAGRP
ncbi:AAA family ATPase [Actinoplanes sp. HUAS TT8]|uniref:AAA family ATPase n=1 Tax=Actinoplanes sp. HUAS TT8 TaxID=3447453 RepID=UPI003F51C439